MAKKIILSDGEYEILCKVLKETYTAQCPALETGADMFYFRELKTHILKENFRFSDTDEQPEEK